MPFPIKAGLTEEIFLGGIPEFKCNGIREIAVAWCMRVQSDGPRVGELSPEQVILRERWGLPGKRMSSSVPECQKKKKSGHREGKCKGDKPEAEGERAAPTKTEDEWTSGTENIRKIRVQGWGGFTHKYSVQKGGGWIISYLEPLKGEVAEVMHWFM